MVGWTVKDIHTEVTSVAALLVERSPPPGSVEAVMAAYKKLQSSLVASICNKIAGLLVLDAGGALDLMQAVIQASLSEAAKGSIQEALDTKLNASS
jgi:hypothetical protein